MGSSQSSSASDGSFSVDPSGRITPRVMKTTTGADGQESEETKQPKTNQQQQHQDGYSSQFNQPLITEPVVSKIVAPPARSSSSNSDISLELADKMTSELKAKYKLNSAEMAGKQRSVFENIENQLVQCLKTNKNQPLKCSKITDEYRTSINEHRKRLLMRASPIINGRNVPLMTTILVVITCILLHVTTISCFGAMSIDLGSEWMKVGLVAPSVQMDIVLNAQSQRKTPMAVAFSNGERYIGDTALDIASKYPERTFTHFLDLVGKRVNDPAVEHYKKRFPHAVITSHEPNSTSILLKHPDGQQFTPLELVAMMIQHAHDQVATLLHSNEPATDVVITVPPFFDRIERRVIRDAAKVVGLNVLRLTNVNSAFALSYGIFRHKDYEPETSDRSNRTSILFIDQGASHTSATIADYHLVEQIDEATGISKNESLPTVTIRGQVYNRYMGGFDMQLKLRDHLVSAFAKTNKIEPSRIIKRGKSMAKLLKEAGRVKKILSANTDHTVRVENVIDDKDLKQPITREEYEELNKDLLDEPIKKLLDELFQLPDVDRNDPLESVIIVGGNTRTPRVQQVLLEYFKLDTLGKSINADEGAALAALYQAASLGRGFRVKRFVLEEFGEERKRYDPAKVSTTPATSDETTTTATPSEQVTDQSTTAASSATSQASEESDSIYSETELSIAQTRLARWREQDYLRLQRLSLKNSLESLLSEAREKLDDNEETIKDNHSQVKILMSETRVWLEDGPLVETDNVTMLTEKFTAIYDLLHPKPPPPPPTPAFDPTKVDLSSIINNETLSILDALNFTNPFARTSNETEADLSNETDGPQLPSTGHDTETTTLGPPHTEL